MKFIVIDIQGFLNPPNFIPKEIAIRDGMKSENLLLKPLRTDITGEELKQVQYLTNHYHGLSFDGGLIDFIEGVNILRKQISNSDLVYVRGHQKEEFLRSIVTCDVDRQKIKNVEKTTPPFRKGESSCFHHNIKKCMCASRNAFDLFNYILNLLPK